MKCYEHESLRDDKSNIESVALSYLPIINDLLEKIGIDASEDLVNDCLLNLIEVLNSDNPSYFQIMRAIYEAIYKFIFNYARVSGFGIIKRPKNMMAMQEIVDILKHQDKEALEAYVKKFKGSSYGLLDRASFNDEYYDKSTLSLEDFIINKSICEELLDYLSPRDKEVIKLYYGFYNNKRYPVKDIASILGMASTPVYNIINQTLDKLRIILEKIEKENISRRKLK